MDKKQLTQLIIWINQQGWSPATSTNYSVRNSDTKDTIYISKSGIDKSLFIEEDLIEMTIYGKKLPHYEEIKSSAETGIHLSLYQKTNAFAVLHTHSVADTVLSRKYINRKELILKNYEVLKGLDGILTHETEIIVPIFSNTQDISELCIWLENYIEQNKHPLYGFLIESHGFYTWGKTLNEAKRHLEVFQFLFLCELEQLKMNN